MTSNISRDQLLEAAGTGAVILTANKRLARALRGEFTRSMQQRGVRVWPTAQIHPFGSWLKQCLEFVGEGWRLLSPHQQRYLWEEQIRRATGESVLELMNLESTTETAVQAHQLLTDYGVSLEGAVVTEDQALFARWRRNYLQLCRQHQYLDQGSLTRRIAEAFAADLLPLPEQVLVTGYDRLPPGAAALLQQLRQRGVSCRLVTLTGKAGTIIRCAARDEEHETECMARWVRRKLEQGGQRIGVVVADLARRRTTIERVLRGQIDPAAGARITESAAVINLSLGDMLARQGVIDAALTMLDDFSFAPLEQVSFFLRSPFVAGGLMEADARAVFERRLRALKQERFRLSELSRLAQTFCPTPRLLQQLGQFGQRSQQARSLLEWTQTFDAELKALGWPGDGTLSSTCYQAAGAWYDELLPALAGLDALTPSVTRQRAVELLRQLARRLEFQTQGTTEAVQVVGLLESAGLFFDHLWVMGMTEGVVPAPPRPNPFIPWQLQQGVGMPHADYHRELEFADQVLARLGRAAPDIVLSYPSVSGDTLLAPSRLILPLAACADPPLAAARDLISLIRHQPLALEPWQDARAPVLTGEHAVGGTSLLKDQAHCPFRAFVHHRLRTRALEQPRPGIAPGVRGDLVHLSLKGLWQSLGDQSRLVSLSEEDLQVMLVSVVDAAFGHYFQDRSLPPAPLLHLEKQRIRQLLREWCCQVEAGRDAFRVIAVEEQQQVQLGPLSLKLVVDRIDQLADGSCLVMDYKTGNQVRIGDMLSEPLLEPQLPLYAVTADRPMPSRGVVVAKVRRGDCRLQGILSDEGLLGKVKAVTAYAEARQRDIADWDGLTSFWRRQLEQLAEDFAAGVATVTPYDPDISCLHCDLPGLCRIGALLDGTGDDNGQ